MKCVLLTDGSMAFIDEQKGTGRWPPGIGSARPIESPDTNSRLKPSYGV